MSRNDIFDAASSPGAQQGIPQQSRDQVQQELGFDIPVETVPLPSLGLAYSPGHPLHQCQTADIRAMTAREEDILTNQNYIENGTVVDKLLKSLIVTKNINYDELLIGDKNAILIAARILGYGADYEFKWDNEKVSVDLTKLSEQEVNPDLIIEGKNEFSYKLPFAQKSITFKLLTHGDDVKIQNEIKGLQKYNKQGVKNEISCK